jgi:hypothetical protein
VLLCSTTHVDIVAAAATDAARGRRELTAGVGKPDPSGSGDLLGEMARSDRTSPPSASSGSGSHSESGYQ